MSYLINGNHRHLETTQNTLSFPFRNTTKIVLFSQFYLKSHFLAQKKLSKGNGKKFLQTEMKIKTTNRNGKKRVKIERKKKSSNRNKKKSSNRNGKKSSNRNGKEIFAKTKRSRI